MIRERKPRGDAVLKTLPKSRQAEIAEHAEQHTLAETCAWLSAAGLQTGRTALSEWLSWWSWRAQFQLVEADTIQFMDQVRRRRPELSDSEIEQFGNDFFQLKAIKLGDPKTFLAFRGAKAHKEIEIRKLGLGERRVRLLEQKAAQADAAEKVLRSDLTEEEKAQRMRAVFGLA